MDALDFSKFDPEEVLVDTALEEYKKGMRFFHLNQLVPLNASIFVVEKILEFPFDVFVIPEDTWFFRLVLLNFYEAGLLRITRLSVDQKGNPYTLTRFKNWIRKNVKPGYKTAFDKYLKKASFSEKVKRLLERAKDLRDTRIAHIQIDKSVGASLNFSEFKEMRDALNSIIRILSFNTERGMLPVMYEPTVQHPVGIDSRSDIERILDSLVKESGRLDTPELQRQYLTDRELNHINFYRGKFGLPEA